MASFGRKPPFVRYAGLRLANLVRYCDDDHEGWRFVKALAQSARMVTLKGHFLSTEQIHSQLQTIIVVSSSP